MTDEEYAAAWRVMTFATARWRDTPAEQADRRTQLEQVRETDD